MQSKIFQFEEDVMSKSVQDAAKVLHEELFIMKSLQTKPQAKCTNTLHGNENFVVESNYNDETHFYQLR